jgi:nitrite reductase/ring-hydroxylating ferredoxin subunit/uncharacterized membrane protein
MAIRKEGMMSGVLSKISASSPWLDQSASKLHSLVKPLFGADGPAGVKDFLYGTWLGHPLHPMMTDVSLSGWTMSMVFDLLGEENASDIALKVGTVSAVGTAVTGAAQWFDVQNLEEPKRIGALHAMLNTAALGFYIASIVLREQDKRDAGLATAWTGHAISMTSAWIGGHLSYVLGIGVSRNAFTEAATEWTDAIADSALVEGTLTRAEVDGEAIMFLRQGDRIYATSAICTHVGGPLDEGERTGTCVKCPWHGSEFDLETGKVNHGPATDSIDIYETRVSNGQVQIRALPA